MKTRFEILKPSIFPDSKIISGVTKKNLAIFPETGFSISPAKILSVEKVNEHRKYLAENFGYSNQKELIGHFKFQKQVHEDTIEIVNRNTVSFDYLKQGVHDGMICAESEIFLCVSIADCCAILIYDPINEIISAIHSGWTGTKLKIVPKAINILKNKFNSNPQDLLVYLSPAASGDRYEVGWEVAQHFPNSIKKSLNEKFLFDNRNEIKLQLIECGVPPQNIETSEVCTISDLDYHSFRRDGNKSGRMAAFICMKKK
ncbi:MAG: peptidoglycan editing factor PgeF [FCB group bacterium]|jgi:YfiH family protein